MKLLAVLLIALLGALSVAAESSARHSLRKAPSHIPSGLLELVGLGTASSSQAPPLAPETPPTCNSDTQGSPRSSSEDSTAHARALPTLPAIDALVAPSIGVDTPGLAVLVTRNGAVLHAKGYGFSDIAANKSVNVNSIFELASVSKQATGLAVRILIRQGKLRLDTKIARVLREFRGKAADGARAVTVNDCLRHLSGLDDYLGDNDFEYSPFTTNREVIRWLADQALLRTPGTAFEYSNSGYIVLASLVAKASGMDFPTFMRRNVWRKLGMSATGLRRPVFPRRRVTGYRGKGVFTTDREDSTVLGDGNVYTSIADLAKYERGLARNLLLPKNATASLFNNGQFNDGSPIVDDEGLGYGFGWTIAEGTRGKVAYHDGSWYGTSTYYLRNLIDGVSVVVLANGADFDGGTLTVAIARAAAALV
jgi:CubicO group peptidase (beta-lactamase class C family)